MVGTGRSSSRMSPGAWMVVARMLASFQDPGDAKRDGRLRAPGLPGEARHRRRSGGADSSPVTEDWKKDRVGAALRGENPTVLARLDEGFAVIGDVQFLPGYCVLISDTPGVDRLTDLPRERRIRFLASAERLAEAVADRVRAPRPGVPADQPGDPGQPRRVPARPRLAALRVGGRARPRAGHRCTGVQRWRGPARPRSGPQHDELRADLVATLAAPGLIYLISEISSRA